MSGLRGILNIRKEKGYTSHDVVAVTRKKLGVKAGHTGTLDPNATGVLPICVGRATKLAEYFAAEDKSYIAEIALGITTDTYDITGNILSESKADISFAELESAARSFVGEISQTPPMYSAVKIGGKKLYELARKGVEVERPSRTVTIHSLRAFEENGKFFIEVNCSKGTYIRSLCADIGEKLGCGAAMGDLVRTRSGVFNIADSVTLDEVTAERVIPIENALPLQSFSIKPEGLKRALNGNPLPIQLVTDFAAKDKKFWLRAPDGAIIGLYSYKKGELQAEVML